MCFHPHVAAGPQFLGARDQPVPFVNLNTRIIQLAADSHSRCFVITSSLGSIFSLFFWILFLHHSCLDASFRKSFTAVHFKRTSQGTRIEKLLEAETFLPQISPHSSANAEVFPARPPGRYWAKLWYDCVSKEGTAPPGGR